MAGKQFALETTATSHPKNRKARQNRRDLALTMF
jgi:hypothetical protein